MNKKIILFLILLGILSGCSLLSLHSGSTYESGEMGSPTYFKKGIILSVRKVIIKGTESGAGVAAGDMVITMPPGCIAGTRGCSSVVDCSGCGGGRRW